MKKVFIRVFQIIEQKDGKKTVEVLVPLPGEFLNDSQAWDSIKMDGNYILLPVYQHVTVKEEV